MRTGPRGDCLFPFGLLFWTLLLFIGLFTTAFAQTTFTADGKISVKSYISTNDTNAIPVKTSAGTVYGVEAFSNNATLAYVKLYNTQVTCGSATAPIWRGMIPYGASSSGAGFGLPNVNGDSYFSAIYMCITLGIADNDTTAPAAGAYIVNVHFK